jgi:hypothetical protein
MPCREPGASMKRRQFITLLGGVAMTTRKAALRYILLMFGVTIVDPASATDLDALGQLLTPAYTAMSYARLCEMESEWRRSEPRGMKGYATNYAEYAKDETIKSLTHEQSLIVLRLAADAAKTEARRQLQEHVILHDKVAEGVRFKEWCAGYATDFIVGFITKFDAEHLSLIEKLEAAKRDQKP